MSETKDEIESIVFQALAHPMRRTILRIVSSRSGGVSYTELMNELGLSTGKLNYHLEQLGGLIVKNEEHAYILTPLGKKAIDQLRLIGKEISSEDERYLKIASVSQRSSLLPAFRWFLGIGVALSTVFIAVWGYLAYIAIMEGAPLIIYVLLPILIVIGVALLVFLINALIRTPEWVKRLERRLLGPQ